MSPRNARVLAFGLSLALAGAAGGLFLRWRNNQRGPALRLDVLEDMAPEEASAALAAAARIESGSLLRVVLSEELVAKMMPLTGRREYDPLCYFRFFADLSFTRKWDEYPGGEYEIATNSLGLRQDAEIQDQKPDLRVLVLGDSHMTGVCANSDCFAGQLDDRLSSADDTRSVEVINGSHGAYSFYHYLGVLERMRYLGHDPDLVVMVVYGGNDFLGTYLWHFFHGTKRPSQSASDRKRLRRVAKERPNALGQVLNAAEYFRRGGEDEVEVALRMAREVTLEVTRQCEELGAGLLVVYLPAPSELPDQAPLKGLLAGVEELELNQADMDLVGAMGDAYLSDLESLGVATLDLRPVFAAHDGLLYWRRDLHLALAGHAVAATAVTPWVEDWWSERSK